MTTTFTTVTDLGSDAEITYSMPAFMAVIAAFEQYAKGNFNTWEYDYSTERLQKLTVTDDFIACGDYVAKLDDETREILADIAQPDAPLVVVEHLGIENDQYFQGYGTAFTEYEECCTGIGETALEAYLDALENVAQMVSSNDYKILHKAIAAYVNETFPKGFPKMPKAGIDRNHYVGISWKL